MRTATCSEELKSLRNDSTLIIYDEAEWWFIDGRPAYLDAKKVIGFSATSHKAKDTAESLYLDALGVKVVDAKMPAKQDMLPVEMDTLRPWIEEKLRVNSDCGFLMFTYNSIVAPTTNPLET